MWGVLGCWEVTNFVSMVTQTLTMEMSSDVQPGATSKAARYSAHVRLMLATSARCLSDRSE